MPSYRVKWEIDIWHVKSPQVAAQRALAVIRDESSTALVFDVTEHNRKTTMRIDLLDLKSSRLLNRKKRRT